MSAVKQSSLEMTIQIKRELDNINKHGNSKVREYLEVVSPLDKEL